MQNVSKAHANRLLDIAKSLNVPVEEFFNPAKDTAKLSVKARVLNLLDSYVTGDDVTLSDKDLLNIVADRILEDK